MSNTRGAGWVLIGVGTHMTATVIVGFALGYAIDSWIDSRPIFMLILGCLGFVGGVLKAFRILTRLG
jgi:F0F1-type ATP synthase assembly protein I